MKLKALIKELKQIQKRHGNIKVAASFDTHGSIPDYLLKLDKIVLEEVLSRHGVSKKLYIELKEN